jgi:Fe-S-cluster containining protein
MGDDRERFERSPTLVVLTHTYGPAGAGGDWRFLKRNEAAGCCVALEGGLHKCRCMIYDDRPLLCREFEAGSEDCLEARRKHGFLQ